METTADATTGTPDCSAATITAVDVTASTSGDAIRVTGTVSETPAPDLRGFIVENSCPDPWRDVRIPLQSTGSFTHTFEYSHHGVRDYGFWLEGCSSEQTPTPESTPACNEE